MLNFQIFNTILRMPQKRKGDNSSETTEGGGDTASVGAESSVSNSAATVKTAKRAKRETSKTEPAEATTTTDVKVIILETHHYLNP